MSSRALKSFTRGAAVAAALGLVTTLAVAKPAHADTWIHFGIAVPTLGVAPSLPPPAPVYAYTYPYAYAYPYGYYAAPRRVEERRVYIHGRDGWQDRDHHDRDDWR
jgi:hypothetical protein